MGTPLQYRIFEPRRGLREIDQRAWKCLERCRKRLKLDTIPLPVPVENWIEGPLEIRFGFTDLSRLGDGVLGAAYVRAREIMIDSKTLSNEARCRFTCAHELGHMILHAKVAEEFRDVFDYSFQEMNKYEREANQFAASFLMPLPLVEVEFLAICRGRGLDPAKLAANLMFESHESEQLWRSDILPVFTKRFEVSATAAVIRFCSIQPRISTRRPILPRAFVERFLEGVDARQQEFTFRRHA